MENRTFSRRRALQIAGSALLLPAVTSARSAWAGGVEDPLTKTYNQLRGLVKPGLNWTGKELNELLLKLPPEAHLSIRQALDISKPRDTIKNLVGDAQAQALQICDGLQWASNNYVGYYLVADKKNVPYHETVQWAARKADVDESIVGTQVTIVVEHELQKKLFADIWGALKPVQRLELLTKIDTGDKIADKIAIAAGSTAAAMSALVGAEYLAGFAFYTTMSSTICMLAGSVGATLPFAAYAGASTLVGILTGPIGWACIAGMVTIGAAAWLAHAGPSRTDPKHTVAAVCQIHALKVAILTASGVNIDDLVKIKDE